MILFQNVFSLMKKYSSFHLVMNKLNNNILNLINKFINTNIDLNDFSSVKIK